MPKSKQQKEAIIGELADKISRAKSVVFATFKGLKVTDTDALRAKSRAENGEYFVAKKTLLRRALTDAKIGEEAIGTAADGGSIGLIVNYDDEVAAARIMAGFAKGKEELVVIGGGLLEGKIVDTAMVKSLAALPSKHELYAKVVGSLAAPMSGMVNVLAGNLRGLVNVFKAMSEKKA